MQQNFGNNIYQNIKQQEGVGFLGNLDPTELPLAMEKMGKENMEKLIELRKQFEQCYKLALGKAFMPQNE
jgi:hypothetical protein